MQRVPFLCPQNTKEDIIMATQPYIALPKALLRDEQYQGMSTDARFLYAYMRDVLRLSMQNGWQDERGYYIKLSRATIGKLLKRSLPTVRKIIGELTALGLVVDRRMGLTRCNRLYVRLLKGETMADFQPKEKPQAASAKKQGFKPERNAFSPSNPYPSVPNLTEPKKNGWKWFVSEGTKWFDAQGRLWQFTDGEVAPYLTGEAHEKATLDLLSQLGMA